mmetsp:Transcript_22261/g.34092  ORF Transcript_22261/g.34092 Transcript_22261/m.34092 type:complete len:476 (+) Transcript_22261:993-2420(+)|eukprot:CAMPEP_0196806422 /NCGR_PEP_ID=MMETSP1362-20130617/6323_1 /TAXON_ID=163516 /ORGANISM="Leptocylindrus danicus, Strain CCMP1856" /LENGTH=475 /DNA_ID=CAMNT_0042179893 /DNA_START=984 /DNA_END=2411 /DNA_ORIENTATION=+
MTFNRSTRWYRAPEILLRSQSYNSPIDLFAVGCILAELLTLRPLFPGSNEIDQLHKLFQVLGTPTELNWPEGVKLLSKMKCKFKPTPPSELNRHVKTDDSDAMTLMSDLLEMNPKKRPTASQALQYPYLQNPALSSSSDVPQSPGVTLTAITKEGDESKHDDKVILQSPPTNQELRNTVAKQQLGVGNNNPFTADAPPHRKEEGQMTGSFTSTSQHADAEKERNPFAEHYLSHEPTTLQSQKRRVTENLSSSFGAPQFQATSSAVSAPTAPYSQQHDMTHSHNRESSHFSSRSGTSTSAHSNHNLFEEVRATAAHVRSTPRQQTHDFPISSNRNNQPTNASDLRMNSSPRSSTAEHNPFQNLENSPNNTDRNSINHSSDYRRRGSTSLPYTPTAYLDSRAGSSIPPFKNRVSVVAKPSSRGMRGIGRRAMGSSSSRLASARTTSPFGGAQQFSSPGLFGGEQRQHHPRTSRYNSV